MISISKKEKDLLAKLFPGYKFPRTMKQDSKRHHYFCTESEELMRPIAGSNVMAAERVKEFDRRRAFWKSRRKRQGGSRRWLFRS